MASHGTNLVVHTNSFKIERINDKKQYFQYDVSFQPELKPASRRIEVFERLQNHTEPVTFTPKVIYDGDAIAYSSRVLAFGQAQSFEVNMSGRDSSKPGFVVTLKRVDAAVIDFTELRAFIEGHINQQTPKVIGAINLLQLIVRQAPNLKYPNNVRSFFTKEAGYRKLGGGLDIWKGFYQSVRPSLKQLLINVDVTSGVMYRDGKFIDVALSVLEQSDVRALRLDASSPAFRKLKSFFKNVFVGLDHLKQRRKRITDIIPRGGHYEFTKKDDSAQMTVQQYYRETYNIHLKYPDIIGIVLNDKGGNKTVVPAELCSVLPNQRYTRKLPQEYTKGMVEFTSEKPRARMEAILNGMGTSRSNSVLDYENSPFVKEAGLTVAKTPALIEGHVLTTPNMIYRGDGPPVTPRNGGWNVVNQKFHDPKNISIWAVVDYSLNKNRARPNTERFVGMLVDCCRHLGMSVCPPQVYKTGSQNVDRDLYSAAVEAHREANGNANKKPPSDLLLVVLPASAADIRFAVKRFGDVLNGIPTQCVREDKIARANNQYCNNVAMKINAKLGGVNAVPSASALERLRKNPFMIMGVDVGHPAPGVVDQPSVASLVFSSDNKGMSYEAVMRIQRPRLEIVENLSPMMKHAIETFVRKHQTPPSSLILFRDGLSEGEYARAAEMEIKAIKDTIDALWVEKKALAKKPLLTYIVVGKKHHVRFFPKSERDGDKSGNCPAGFVADRGIGNPVARDFYLQSHGGLLGTSRPSHYIVLLDENYSGNLDILQNLSFGLCHAYARATRSVSIPAPVYYADIVCARANFHFEPSLRYDDSAGSSVSGGASFDIARWEKGYQKTHGSMAGKMYFM
ncbi:Piwi-domain-containing protein [Scleroderma citrinum]